MVGFKQRIRGTTALSLLNSDLVASDNRHFAARCVADSASRGWGLHLGSIQTLAGWLCTLVPPCIALKSPGRRLVLRADFRTAEKLMRAPR